MAISQPDLLYLNLHEESAEEERQEMPAAVLHYFDETGCAGSTPCRSTTTRAGSVAAVCKQRSRFS